MLVSLAFFIDISEDDFIFFRGPIAHGIRGWFLELSVH